jgi:hypothetical protein
MFIHKDHYLNLVNRLDRLERQTKTHAEFLHNDHRKIEHTHEQVTSLEKTVGKPNPSVWDSSALAGLMGYLNDSTKPMTLLDKTQQIMDHLGLVVSHTQSETKIIKKPVATKGKKGKK